MRSNAKPRRRSRVRPVWPAAAAVAAVVLALLVPTGRRGGGMAVTVEALSLTLSPPIATGRAAALLGGCCYALYSACVDRYAARKVGKMAEVPSILPLEDVDDPGSIPPPDTDALRRTISSRTYLVTDPAHRTLWNRWASTRSPTSPGEYLIFKFTSRIFLRANRNCAIFGNSSTQLSCRPLPPNNSEQAPSDDVPTLSVLCTRPPAPSKH